MEAIILLAGYGSRLDRQDLPHKSLLPFGEETLLSRHLKCLQNLGIQKVHLIIGHNGEAVKNYALELNLQLSLHFIENPVYLTTGNTLSMVMGLRHCEGETLILDGDVLYPPQSLTDYVENAQRSSFALIPADIEDAEMRQGIVEPFRNHSCFHHQARINQSRTIGFRVWRRSYRIFHAIQRRCSTLCQII